MPVTPCPILGVLHSGGSPERRPDDYRRQHFDRTVHRNGQSRPDVRADPVHDLYGFRAGLLR